MEENWERVQTLAGRLLDRLEQATGVAKSSVETVMKMAEKIDLGGDGKYSSRAPR